MGTRGGYQPGGGRPKGAINKKTLGVIERAKAAGLLPLDVLLNDMRYYYNTSESEVARLRALPQTPENLELLKLALSFKSIARECAKDAAPYVHPKLTAISAPGGGPVQVALEISFK